MQNSHDRTIHHPHYAAILAGVYRIVESLNGVAERRQAILELLSETLDGDKAHWAWGRGDREGKVVSPLGIVMIGYSDAERLIFQRMGTDPRSEHEFRRPFVERMNGRRQATATRTEIFTEDQWSRSMMRECVQEMGLDSWVHSIRFASENSWSNILIFRNASKPEFASCEAALLDLAMTSIPCLQASVEESLPPEKFENLTSRQRTVMTLLLDGHARKKIASELDISPETVNDHIKAIYQVFQVKTHHELAAIFLRGK